MRRLLFLVALTAMPACASTPAAWAASARKVKAVCSKVSGLKDVRVSEPVIFSDAIGRSAVLVSGTWPQPYMHGAKGTMLCLFDRRRGTAETSEAKGWQAPVKPAR